MVCRGFSEIHRTFEIGLSLYMTKLLNRNQRIVQSIGSQRKVCNKTGSGRSLKREIYGNCILELWISNSVTIQKRVTLSHVHIMHYCWTTWKLSSEKNIHVWLVEKSFLTYLLFLCSFTLTYSTIQYEEVAGANEILLELECNSEIEYQFCGTALALSIGRD